MENKIEIKLYKGLELKITVENGVLVAEYSEEEKQELRNDDLCIFWNEDKGSAKMELFFEKNGEFFVDKSKTYWENAIKFKSKEQYLAFIRS